MLSKPVTHVLHVKVLNNNRIISVRKKKKNERRSIRANERTSQTGKTGIFPKLQSGDPVNYML